MRQAFAAELCEIMANRTDVYILTADTGFHVLDELRSRFPQRFLNVGICEAAMIGMAAGLAHSGKQVFCYGIAPFVTARCLDQIRVDICYANLPVKIVGVGGGLTYGPTGMTHHAVEDIAIMSALPNMTVVCPGDPVEVRCAVRALVSMAAPCYLRLGKSGETMVHAGEPAHFSIGHGLRLSAGTDVALVATGNMLATASETCRQLAGFGISATLVSMHTVKPLDRELVVELASRHRLVATMEEHSIVGGLGSLVAGVIADSGIRVSFLRFALPDEYVREAGDQMYFRQKYGLTPQQIASRICSVLRDRPLSVYSGAGEKGSR